MKLFVWHWYPIFPREKSTTVVLYPVNIFCQFVLVDVLTTLGVADLMFPDRSGTTSLLTVENGNSFQQFQFQWCWLWMNVACIDFVGTVRARSNLSDLPKSCTVVLYHRSPGEEFEVGWCVLLHGIDWAHTKHVVSSTKYSILVVNDISLIFLWPWLACHAMDHFGLMDRFIHRTLLR